MTKLTVVILKTGLENSTYYRSEVDAYQTIKMLVPNVRRAHVQGGFVWGASTVGLSISLAGV